MNETYEPEVDFLLFPSRGHSVTVGANQGYNVTDLTVLIPSSFPGPSAHVFVVTDVGQNVDDTNRGNNVARVTTTPLNLSAIGQTGLTSAGIQFPNGPTSTGTQTDPVPVVLYSNMLLRLCVNNTGRSTAVAPWFVMYFIALLWCVECQRLNDSSIVMEFMVGLICMFSFLPTN